MSKTEFSFSETLVDADDIEVAVDAIVVAVDGNVVAVDGKALVVDSNLMIDEARRTGEVGRFDSIWSFGQYFAKK